MITPTIAGKVQAHLRLKGRMALANFKFALGLTPTQVEALVRSGVIEACDGLYQGYYKLPERKIEPTLDRIATNLPQEEIDRLNRLWAEIKHIENNLAVGQAIPGHRDLCRMAQVPVDYLNDAKGMGRPTYFECAKIKDALRKLSDRADQLVINALIEATALLKDDSLKTIAETGFYLKPTRRRLCELAGINEAMAGKKRYVDAISELLEKLENQLAELGEKLPRYPEGYQNKAGKNLSEIDFLLRQYKAEAISRINQNWSFSISPRTGNIKLTSLDNSCVTWNFPTRSTLANKMKVSSTFFWNGNSVGEKANNLYYQTCEEIKQYYQAQQQRSA